MTATKELETLVDPQFGKLGRTEHGMLAVARRLEGDTERIQRDEARQIAASVHAAAQQILDKAALAVHGDRMKPRLRLLLMGLLFGRNSYLVGTSGVAKTFMVKVLAQLVGLPFSRVDGNPQLAPSDLLGGEFLTGRGWHRVLGPLTKPTPIIILDEGNRLSAATQSVVLQPMEERKLQVPDYESGAGFREMKMLGCTAFVVTANPSSYGGTAQTNEAMLDRVHIGFDVDHPKSSERVALLRNEFAHHDVALQPVPLNVTLSQVRATVEHVVVPDALDRLIVQLSWLCSPREFRESSRWTDDLAVDVAFQGGSKRAFEAFRARVDEAFYEGGNPRGEQAARHNARALAALGGRLEVNVEDVCEGFFSAFRMRMKAYPGFDAQVPAILRDAIGLMGHKVAL